MARGVGGAGCEAMHVTTNGQFATLQNGWARDVVVDLPGSIRNTSTRIVQFVVVSLYFTCGTTPPPRPPSPCAQGREGRRLGVRVSEGLG